MIGKINQLKNYLRHQLVLNLGTPITRIAKIFQNSFIKLKLRAIDIINRSWRIQILIFLRETTQNDHNSLLYKFENDQEKNLVVLGVVDMRQLLLKSAVNLVQRQDKNENNLPFFSDQ